MRWRSALQMPRDISRLTYELTGITCDRLQWMDFRTIERAGFGSIAEFRTWWDRASSGSKPRSPRDGESYAENPWVWIVLVKRVEVKR